MNSYGDDDDDASSSSDSEDEILRQFEMSVSRSQNFRTAAANIGEQQPQQTHPSLGRRHKFTRLSDQEEGSTEPSDCEGTHPDTDLGIMIDKDLASSSHLLICPDESKKPQILFFLEIRGCKELRERAWKDGGI